MTWLKDNLRVMLTLMLVALSGFWGLARLWAQQDALAIEVAQKADKEPIVRELDQIQGKLDALDRKIDNLITK